MNRRPAGLFAGLALFVALCVGGAWVIFERAVRLPEDTAAPAPAAAATPRLPERAEEAVVESVQGAVQRGAGATWAPLSPGDRLRANESLRTGAGGGTALRIGDKSRLALAPSSHLLIRELTQSLHRFKLIKGHVRVDYRKDDQRVLRIEGGEGDSVAETQGARFSVLSTGRSVAIATDEGSVDLESHGGKVRVEAGRQSLAQAGAVPTAPQLVPASLWLKVANAMAQAPEGICGSLQGTAPAGSQVTVDGRPVELDAHGSFALRVPRPAGRDDVTVAIRDAAGRTISRKVPCSDEQGAVDDVALQWRKGGN